MSEDTIVFAGTVVVTLEEVRDAGAWTSAHRAGFNAGLKRLLAAKEENLVQAFRRTVVDECLKRGWPVEYAENTTMDEVLKTHA